MGGTIYYIVFLLVFPKVPYTSDNKKASLESEENKCPKESRHSVNKVFFFLGKNSKRT